MSIERIDLTLAQGQKSGETIRIPLPNNLKLRGIVEGATGQALRTCYVYDSAGNRIAETKPRASLASCS